MTSLIPIPTPRPVPYTYFTSSISSPLFSMQDALLTYSGFSSTNPPSADRGLGTLFRSGCVVDGILNCTAACQDVNQIFADLHTFQNCMAIVSIQELIQRNISVTLDDSFTALADNFAINITEPSFDSLASGISQTILPCLYQYQYKYPGNDTDEMWEPWYFANYPEYEPANLVQLPNICDNLTSVPLNADVGGIGVRKATFF